MFDRDTQGADPGHHGTFSGIFDMGMLTIRPTPLNPLATVAVDLLARLEACYGSSKLGHQVFDPPLDRFTHVFAIFVEHPNITRGWRCFVCFSEPRNRDTPS
jgi:hypothetical protein